VVRRFGDPSRIRKLPGASAPVGHERLDIGVLPGTGETRRDRLRLRGPTLLAERLLEAGEGPAALAVPAEVIAERRLGLCVATGLQQDRAEHLAHRLVPRRRLVVREPVLEPGRFAE